MVVFQLRMLILAIVCNVHSVHTICGTLAPEWSYNHVVMLTLGLTTKAKPYTFSSHPNLDAARLLQLVHQSQPYTFRQRWSHDTKTFLPLRGLRCHFRNSSGLSVNLTTKTTPRYREASQILPIFIAPEKRGPACGGFTQNSHFTPGLLLYESCFSPLFPPKYYKEPSQQGKEAEDPPHFLIHKGEILGTKIYT